MGYNSPESTDHRAVADVQYGPSDKMSKPKKEKKKLGSKSTFHMHILQLLKMKQIRKCKVAPPNKQQGHFYSKSMHHKKILGTYSDQKTDHWKQIQIKVSFKLN